MSEDASFGRWLQQRRKALGLTQAELAQCVGCATVTIHKIELEERRPSTAIAERLAACLQIADGERRAFVRFARGESALVQPTLLPPHVLPMPLQPLPRSSLPVPLTPVFGRDQEIGAIAALLQRPQVRLVTLTGLGGVGKTCMALQVAAHLAGTFADGVCFVALEAIADPALVSSTIARALSVGEGSAQSILDRLSEILRERHLLLVLDNFEQVLPAAPAVTQLLRAAPQLTMLVTSRAPLHLHVEQVFPVPPLATPDPRQLPDLGALAQVAAVALFLRRARAVQPDFALTAANAQAIATICARLDGLPLAIELAATRSTLLAPDALLARLEHRLALLTGGARDAPVRQQTLRMTIDWSYQLLDPAAQRVFAHLAVFVGGWTLEAAEAICAAPGERGVVVLEQLQALVEQHLVRLDIDVAGQPWYRMLETIREYAREHLAVRADAEALAQRYAAYYLTLAEAAEVGLGGPEQVAWMNRLEQEYGNLYAVVQWTLAHGQGEWCLRLTTALQLFWRRRGQYHDVLNSLEAALALPGTVPPSVRENALLAAAPLVSGEGNGPRAAAYRAEALALAEARGDQLSKAAALLGLNRAEEALVLFEQFGDTRGMARALTALGQDMRQGQTARTRLEAARDLFAQLGDYGSIASVHHMLGRLACEQGAYARAETLFADGLALGRQVHDATSTAWILCSWGELGLIQGDDAAARARLEESADLFRSRGVERGYARALYNLGYIAQHAGNHARMAACFSASLWRFRHLRHLHNGVAIGIAGMASVAAMAGRLERAARLFGAAETLQESLGEYRCVAHRIEIAGNIEKAREQLDATTWMNRWTEGQALTLEQAITEALENVL